MDACSKEKSNRWNDGVCLLQLKLDRKPPPFVVGVVHYLFGENYQFRIA